MAFEQALKLAQDAGYAEADPTLDVEGWDAAHKLILLIMLAFGEHYPLEKLPVWGVSIVDPQDIGYAQEFGRKIKLIARARKVESGQIEAGVFPALIKDDDLLAAVHGSFNAIRVVGNAGPVLLHGKGAGDLPTASAVLADIIAVAGKRAANNTGFVDDALPEADILDLDEFVSCHYLRFSVPDKAGVLFEVSKVLKKHDISLKQVVQKKSTTTPQGEVATLVFLTHECTARRIHAAMRDLEATGLPQDRIMHLRIL
jgi:homoserine dehydrogenase